MFRFDDKRVDYTLQPDRMAHYVVDGYAALATKLAEKIDYDAQKVAIVEQHGEHRYAKLAQFCVGGLAASHYFAILGLDRRCRLLHGLVENGALVLEIGIDKSAGDAALFRNHAKVHIGESVPGEKLQPCSTDFALAFFVVYRALLRHQNE